MQRGPKKKTYTLNPLGAKAKATPPPKKKFKKIKRKRTKPNQTKPKKM
jgi:hypothetical protein